jgi:hypothetical protein
VVEQHERGIGEAVVLDTVAHGDGVLAEPGGDAPRQDEVLAEHFAVAHGAADAELVGPVLRPRGVGVDRFGRDVAEPAVQPVALAAGRVGSADIREAAAGEQPAAPGAEPLEVGRIVEVRRDLQIAREPRQRRALERGGPDVHAAVRVDGERKPAAVVDLQHAHAAPFAIVRHEPPDRGQLLHSSEPGSQICFVQGCHDERIAKVNSSRNGFLIKLCNANRLRRVQSFIR